MKEMSRGAEGGRGGGVPTPLQPPHVRRYTHDSGKYFKRKKTKGSSDDRHSLHSACHAHYAKLQAGRTAYLKRPELQLIGYISCFSLGDEQQETTKVHTYHMIGFFHTSSSH